MSLHTDFLCSVPKIYTPPLNIRTCSTRHKTIQVTIFLYILRKRPPTPTKKMSYEHIYSILSPYNVLKLIYGPFHSYIKTYTTSLTQGMTILLCLCPK